METDEVCNENFQAMGNLASLFLSDLRKIELSVSLLKIVQRKKSFCLLVIIEFFSPSSSCPLAVFKLSSSVKSSKRTDYTAEPKILRLVFKHLSVCLVISCVILYTHELLVYRHIIATLIQNTFAQSS